MHSTVTGAVSHSETLSCQSAVITRGSCLRRSTGRTGPQGVECGAARLCGHGHARTHGCRGAQGRTGTHAGRRARAGGRGRGQAQGRARNMRDMQLHTQYGANMCDTQVFRGMVFWGCFPSLAGG